MSDSEDENYVTFGVPLEPIDEDNVPRKKPMTIEDQYAYDAQGRRRFHGAFTGGFSAGYFNTVGTRDGWRPQQFKSSRSSKAGSITQRPEDFMDEEDTSEFGIAPTGIRTSENYVNSGQRGTKRERITRDNNNPIPGTPVLKDLLKPVKETVGIMLLKKMGWRPGQGVGSRLTKKQKAKIKRRNERMKDMEQGSRRPNVENSSEDSSEDDYENVTFAPDDYEPFRCNPKDNYFGIGYSGLDRRTILSGHVNLFETPAFSIQDKNKKLSIHGQAFGVGAFEADDEDIYEREDMSRYDFSLGPERKTKTRWSEDGSSKSLNNCLEGFVLAKNKLELKKVFPPPELPKNFVPVHTIRKSRFYPPIGNVSRRTENGKRKDLTAADRAKILEDTYNTYKKPFETHPNSVPSVASNIISKTLNLHGKQQTEERQKEENQRAKAAVSWMEKLTAQSFVKGGTVGPSKDSDGNLKKLEEFKDPSTTCDKQSKLYQDNSAKSNVVKPYFSDPDKQRRFEQYLVFVKEEEKNKLESIQPLSMTEWDREHERIEFEQAVKLFEQPTNEYVANKFTSASDPGRSDVSAHSSQEDEIKQAVKMKMFGKLTRERVEWKPVSIVCKRFNIPEPKVGCAQPEMQKRSAKFSIFDSLDWNNSVKFLQASKETNDVSISSSVSENTDKNMLDDTTKHTVDNTDSNVKETSDDIFFHNRETIELVSEKMRNFEVSYEKVFGKEVSETSLKTDSSGTTDTETMDQQDKRQNNISSTMKTSMSKSKSEEKKDLFKSIFLSSSEESDSESNESLDSEAVKSVLIGKLSSEINVNRNTSPPRGIFAKVDLDSLVNNTKSNVQLNETTSKEKDANTVNSELETEPQQDNSNSNPLETQLLSNMYGPVLPSRLLKTESKTAEPSSSQTSKPVFKSVVVPKPKVDSEMCGVWVEREKVKKSKKEKKKHKHKEHKSSKHKRKSRKEKRAS